jgi:CheY-like chemotaxis protein
MKVLLVDDDADDRSLFIQAIFQVDKTITCYALSDGQQALKFLEDVNNPVPDYIFLDLRMPRIDGRKCLQKIREDDRLVKVPVIIYTTSTNVNDAKELADTGATHFISKPTNPEEVYYLVSHALNEKWG